MVNPFFVFTLYLADSLKIFVIPVTTIHRSSQRGLSLLTGVMVLILLTITASALSLILSYVPGGLMQPLSYADVTVQAIINVIFFLISYLLLFALIVIFGGATDLAHLLSAKLCLVSAIIGGFLLALIAKLLIGLLFLGVNDGFAGGLLVLGENFGVMAMGLVLAVYTLIVVRFGGQISWGVSVAVGIIHFLLMLAIIVTYDIIILKTNTTFLSAFIQI